MMIDWLIVSLKEFVFSEENSATDASLVEI